jgi:hypothetical protein
MIRALYKLWLINKKLPLCNARGASFSLWRIVSRAIEREAHERVTLQRRIEDREENYELFNL